jgi:hypothetical protein
VVMCVGVTWCFGIVERYVVVVMCFVVWVDVAWCGRWNDLNRGC